MAGKTVFGVALLRGDRGAQVPAHPAARTAGAHGSLDWLECRNECGLTEDQAYRLLKKPVAQNLIEFGENKNRRCKPPCPPCRRLFRIYSAPVTCGTTAEESAE
jgi:hypothetical protein